MGSTEKIENLDARFEELLGRYLLLRSRSESPQHIGDHMDEDTLTAFTEGNLTFRESDNAVTHLADCTFCRHKTAELVRLDLALSEPEPVSGILVAGEPAKVSEVIGGILSRLFGSGEAAVFAHEEKEREEEAEDSDKSSKEKEKE